MIHGAPMVSECGLIGHCFYHCQDRGVPRKHPRSCSMVRCAAFGRLQKKTLAKKNLTQRRKERNGREALINNLLKRGVWSEAAENRYSQVNPPSLCAFASWREVFYSLRRCVLGGDPQFSEWAARRNRFMIALPTPISGTGST
jgi:hypothetical protein